MKTTLKPVKLIAFLTLMAIGHCSFAQWKIAPSSNHFSNDITFVNSSIGYEVGYTGYIARTTNGGITWQSQISGTDKNFYDVHFISTTEGYVGGEILLKTIDGGDTWAVLDHSIANGNGVINSIFFINADTGWYCTSTGKIYKTTNAGSSWIQYDKINYELFSIWFTSSSTGWAVGNGGVVRKTTDGGITWAQQSVATGAYPVKSVQFISPTTGWLTVENGFVFQTTDGGGTWTSNSSPIAGFLHETWFTSATIGYGACNTGVIKSTDGGNTWSATSLNGSGTIYDIAFYSSTGGTALKDGGVNPYTTNGGINWTEVLQSSTSNTSNAYSVYFINANTGWLAGENGMVRTTSNGGEAWTDQTTGTSALLSSVFFTTFTEGWIAGTSGTIRRSTDAGVSWTAQTSGVTSTLFGMYFTSTATGVVVGDMGVIRRTTNTGTNWNSVTSGTTNALRSVHFVSATTGWIVGHGGVILKTTDGGVTWTSQTSGTTNNLLAVNFVSATIGYAVGASGTILKTTNGGTTWSIQTSNITDHLTCLYFGSSISGWALGYGGKILQTSNGGITWTLVAQLTGNQPINAVNFTTVNRAYAVGNAGIKLQYSASCTPPAPVDYTFSSGNNICTGTTAHLKASGIGKIGWYSASTGGTYLGGGRDFITPVLTSNTTYYAQDSVCNPGTRTAITVTISTTSPATTVNLSGATFTAIETGATYQWMKCDNGDSLLPGRTAQSYTAAAYGSYSVILNLNGCIDTSSCVSYSLTSVSPSATSEQLSVFPNPASDKIMLEYANDFSQQGTVYIKIIDMLGNLVYEKKNESPQNMLEISFLISGLYVLEVEREGKYFRKNFIKQ